MVRPAVWKDRGTYSTTLGCPSCEGRLGITFPNFRYYRCWDCGQNWLIVSKVNEPLLLEPVTTILAS